jgi:hypothetical protein
LGSLSFSIVTVLIFFLFFFHSALSVRVGFFSLPLIMAVSVNV